MSAAAETTSQPSLAETDTYVFWSANEGAGWMHLLPALTGLRLLCVDASGAVAWALARECRHVTVIHSPPHWPEGGHREHRCGNTFSTGLDALLVQAQQPGFTPYDGLVIHDPLGLRVHRSSLPALQRLLGAARELLAPSGWLYLGASNPGSLPHWRDRLRRTTRPGPAPVPLGTLLGLLRSAGAAQVRLHPYLMAHGRIAEVLPDEGYHPTKNCEALGERLKEWLFRWVGARRLAPAFGLLGLRHALTRSALDGLLQRAGGARAPQGDDAVMKQYLVFSGHKAIVSAGPPGRADQDVIMVLTGDAVSKRGRALEAPHLGALARMAPIARYVPRLVGQFEAGTADCVVMERIPGVTLDRDLPPLERVTDAALDFLVLLHRETATPVVMQGTGFDRLVTPLLRAAADRNPDFAAVLQGWNAPLKQVLDRSAWPAVFEHGDYKVENVIYEPGSTRLLSVIDWEHARRPGLPLLDLMYLLVYNRVIRGDHWTVAVDKAVVRNEWTTAERGRLQRYMHALGLADGLLLPLRALFMAHHIGCRIHLAGDPSLRGKVGEMLDCVTAQLRDAAFSTPAVTH